MHDAPHPSSLAIIDLYERHAAQWDRDRLKTLVERGWLDLFTELLPPSGAVLDLGCGSGEPIAIHIARQGFRLTGVDASRAMIGLCRERLPTHDWLVADMRAIDLGRTFDGVLAWDSFFHLPPDDQRRMFEIFERHAALRAPLLFTSGIQFGEAIGDYRGDALYHASLDTADYARLLAEHGFSIVRHVEHDETCHRHSVWLAIRK